MSHHYPPPIGVAFGGISTCLLRVFVMLSWGEGGGGGRSKAKLSDGVSIDGRHYTERTL